MSRIDIWIEFKWDFYHWTGGTTTGNGSCGRVALAA